MSARCRKDGGEAGIHIGQPIKISWGDRPATLEGVICKDIRIRGRQSDDFKWVSRVPPYLTLLDDWDNEAFDLFVRPCKFL